MVRESIQDARECGACQLEGDFHVLAVFLLIRGHARLLLSQAFSNQAVSEVRTSALSTFEKSVDSPGPLQKATSIINCETDFSVDSVVCQDCSSVFDYLHHIEISCIT